MMTVRTGLDAGAMTYPRLLNAFHAFILSIADERKRDAIEEALRPPNRVDPLTGLPYGWNDGDELAGFADELAAFDDTLTGD